MEIWIFVSNTVLLTFLSTNVVHVSNQIHSISKVPTHIRNDRLQSRLKYYLIIYKNGTVGGILPQFRKDGKTFLFSFISNWPNRLTIPVLEEDQVAGRNNFDANFTKILPGSAFKSVVQTVWMTNILKKWDIKKFSM